MCAKIVMVILTTQRSENKNKLNLKNNANLQVENLSNFNNNNILKL